MGTQARSRKRPPALSPADEADVRQLYARGLSPLRIAMRYAVSRSTIYRACAASRPQRKKGRAA